jgi:hypothetical protein
MSSKILGIRKLFYLVLINSILIFIIFQNVAEESFSCLSLTHQKLYKIKNDFFYFDCNFFKSTREKISKKLKSGYIPLSSLKNIPNEIEARIKQENQSCQSQRSDIISCRLSNSDNIKIDTKEKLAKIRAILSNDINSASMMELKALGLIDEDMENIYTEYTKIAYIAYLQELSNYPKFRELISLEGDILIFNFFYK